MNKIVKTIYNTNLRRPYDYTIVVGNHKFRTRNKREIGAFVRKIWDNELFPTPAYIYYNIDWDCDNVLYAKYELINE